jgi:hypothetical protein
MQRFDPNPAGQPQYILYGFDVSPPENRIGLDHVHPRAVMIDPIDGRGKLIKSLLSEPKQRLRKIANQWDDASFKRFIPTGIADEIFPQYVQPFYLCSNIAH